MQSHRPPIFKDLLAHNISQEKLNQLLEGLTTDLQGLHPVTEESEVNKPFYCVDNLHQSVDNLHLEYLGFYDTALCFAVYMRDEEIISALTKMNINPNFSNSSIDNEQLASAEPTPLTPLLPLAIALYNAEDEGNTFAPVISLLLNIPGIDIYATTHAGWNLFLYAKGNLEFILRLFELDPQVASLELEEKKNMSNQIAAAYSQSTSLFKDERNEKKMRNRDVNMAVCNALSAAYPSSLHQERIKDEINHAYPLTTSGQPITEIVLSYLFKPKSDSLQHLEKWNKENAPTFIQLGGRT